MPLDPSIPLSVQPFKLPSPAELMTLRDLSTRTQMNQMALAAEVRRQKADQALRSVYSDPTSRDDKGGLTPNALARIEAIDPATGMQVRSQMALAAQREAQTKASLARLQDSELGIHMKKNEMLQSGGTAALTAYKDAKGRGIPENEARSQAQDVYSSQLEQLRHSGVFSEDELRSFPTSFDPQKLEAGVASMLKAKDYFTVEHQRRQDAAKAPTTRTRLAGTSEVQEEWDPATSSWKKVGGGPRFKPEGEDGKPLTDLAKLNADFKAGRITKEQFDASSKKKTDVKPTATTIAEKMNPVMLASVKLDLKELDTALSGIEGLKTKTGSIFFDEHEQSKNAFVRMFKRNITSDHQQQYDTIANRIANAIASVQSMGRGQISDAKIMEAKKLVPVPGDSAGNVKRKLERIELIKKQAQEVLESPLKGERRATDDLGDMLDFWEK